MCIGPKRQAMSISLTWRALVVLILYTFVIVYYFVITISTISLAFLLDLQEARMNLTLGVDALPSLMVVGVEDRHELLCCW